MKSVEVKAKSIEDAIEKALEELKLEREDIEVEVLEEPSKGLFGLIGTKDAKVRVTSNISPLKIGSIFLEKTCRLMGLTVLEIEKNQNEAGYITFDLRVDNPGLLIGRRGETLDSLQYITSIVINKKVKDRCRVILDTEDYRQKREQILIKLANRLAEKVKYNKKSIFLEPMNPHERRIIHTALQDDPMIKTFSEGEDPYRKVVIAFKKS